MNVDRLLDPTYLFAQFVFHCTHRLERFERCGDMCQDEVDGARTTLVRQCSCEPLFKVNGGNITTPTCRVAGTTRLKSTSSVGTDKDDFSHAGRLGESLQQGHISAHVLNNKCTGKVALCQQGL